MYYRLLTWVINIYWHFGAGNESRHLVGNVSHHYSILSTVHPQHTPRHHHKTKHVLRPYIYSSENLLSVLHSQSSMVTPSFYHVITE